MKMTEEKESALAAQQPVFHKVAENLYRLESSGGYYALVKRGGKQFRRSCRREFKRRILREFKMRHFQSE